MSSSDPAMPSAANRDEQETPDDPLALGRIALQSEGGEIHFRKVELTPIAR